MLRWLLRAFAAIGIVFLASIAVEARLDRGERTLVLRLRERAEMESVLRARGEAAARALVRLARGEARRAPAARRAEPGGRVPSVASPPPGDPPLERLTDEDRRALDRVVERAAGGRR